MSESLHRRAAEMIRGARRGVAFTGAGISTESGIPDFRSPGGVWATSQPVMYDEFLDSAEARHEYWRQKSISHADFERARPNDGHRLLAQWEQAGWLTAVVTQNIDGMHQLAGSRRVVELHGTARQIGCLDCQRRFEAGPWVEKFLAEQQVPDCPDCGGLLKHATISFGQQLDPAVLMEASQLARQADVFLAMGSSLVVEPAAGLPRLAKQRGAKLIIVNRDPTPQDALADLVLHDSIGEALTRIAELTTNEH